MTSDREILREARAIARCSTAAAVHAFHALQGIRLASQAGNSLDGQTPGNQLDPDRLNEFDRRVLPEGLRQARKLQQGLKARYHIDT